jgi:hypothetical protein
VNNIGAVALVVNFVFLVSGSWLLVVGTLRDGKQGRLECD